MIDKIVHAENGAAVEFLNKLYEFLTKRKVQQPANPPPSDDIPAFARPTASQVMHETMKQSEMQENQDIDTAERALKDSMSSHLEQIQQDRSADPERFTAISKTPSKILRGPTRTVGIEEASMAQIQVKEVKVNQVNSINVGQLRAQKEGHASASRGLGQSGSRTTGYGGSGSVTPILDDCVRTVLGAHPIMAAIEAEAEKSLVAGFLSNVTSRGQEVCPEPLAAEVFQQASSQSGELAAICLDDPKQFWVLTTSIYSSILMDCEETSPTFASATQAMVDLGKRMVSQDAAKTTEMFCDFYLKPLSTIMLNNTGKHHACLRILYAFCAQDATSHIDMIKKLQEEVQELPIFVNAMTILIFMERNMNDALLDLYLYYCLIGTSPNQSPSLRAASIAMLSVVVTHNVSMVVEMLPQLTSLTEDDSWEVHAQLLVVCSTMLRQLSPESDYTAEVLKIVNAVLTPAASVNIRKVGLSYLAKNVETHRALLPLYLQVLLSLPRNTNAKKFVVSTDPADSEELAVAGAPAGGKYRLAPLPLSPGWAGLSIAQQLVQEVQDSQPEHMEVEQMQALLACLTTSPAKETVFSTDMAAWAEVFNHARDYVFVALCDAECCDLALCILREFVLRSELQEKVLQEGTLLGSLRLLYPIEPGADQGCQERVAAFLEEMYDAGGPYSTAIEQLLENFAHNHMDQFEKSQLRALREKIGGQ